MQEVVEIPQIPIIHISPTLNTLFLAKIQTYPCQISYDALLDDHWIIFSEEDAIFLFTDTLARDSAVTIATRLENFFDHFPEGIIVMPGYPHKFASLPASLYQLVLGSVLLQGIVGHRILPVRHEDMGVVILQYARRVQFPRDHRVQGRFKPKMDSIEDQRFFLLAGLINCAEKKSEILMEKFPIPYDLFRNVLENPEKVTQFKGFGPDFITTNTRLLNKDFHHDLQEDSLCD